MLGPKSKLVKAAMVALLSVTATPAVSAEPIELAIDIAQVLKLERPAGTIAIGNPNIADVTVIDATTLVLTGKSTGLTNIIILDHHGGEFSSYSVRVITHGGKYVSVRSSQGQRSFFCNGICDSAPASERAQGVGSTEMAPVAPAAPVAPDAQVNPAVEQVQAATAEQPAVF